MRSAAPRPHPLQYRLPGTPSRVNELARYSTREGPRRVVEYTIDRSAQIVDEPVGEVIAGRPDEPSYLIHSGSTNPHDFRPWLPDYLAQAELLGACPMSRDGLRAMLARGD